MSRVSDLIRKREARRDNGMKFVLTILSFRSQCALSGLEVGPFQFCF